jgi:hypothetical protein
VHAHWCHAYRTITKFQNKHQITASWQLQLQRSLASSASAVTTPMYTISYISVLPPCPHMMQCPWGAGPMALMLWLNG